jgi:mannose-6-phosphate isomerase-like protein (cupin superfamily)
MTNFEDVVAHLYFEDKQTDDEEKFGIHRLFPTKGCIEFVKLYTNIKYKAHIHDQSSARFIFLKGTGKVFIGEEAFAFEPGFQIDAPTGVKHGFEINNETIFLSIQTNPIQNQETGEIDIRYE